jgi:lipopolysaccharide assembly outer membrane protein LptD (OstA)
MKLLAVDAGIATVLVPAMSQDDNFHLRIGTPNGVVLNLTASSMQRDVNAAPSVVHLKGNVEIKTCCTGAGAQPRQYMVLRADEASYNDQTGEIEARGVVRVTFEPPK